MIKVAKLFGKKAAHKLAFAGLHKIAAKKLQAEGISVPDELNIKTAMYAFGRQQYIKNAEFKNIIDGLVCFKELVGE